MTARRRTDDIDTETIADVRVLQDWRSNVDTRLSDIEKAVHELPDALVQKLDDRYASKREVEELKETVDPITKLRRRIWAGIVGLIITEMFVLWLLQFWIKEYLR
jgi:predicted trehalose synthase